MILARIRSIFSWSRITALILAYYALGSLYSTGIQLWNLCVFVSESHTTQAQVIDMRRKEVGRWVELLNTGEPLLHGSPKYFPIVSYDAPQGPLRCELLEARSAPYIMGEIIPVRLHEGDSRVCKESHGFFLWGAGLLRLVLSSLLLYIAYRLLLKKVKQKAKDTDNTLLKLNEKLQSKMEQEVKVEKPSPPKKPRKPRAKRSPKAASPPAEEGAVAAPVKKARKPRQSRAPKA